jgi:hypothetical protein
MIRPLGREGSLPLRSRRLWPRDYNRSFVQSLEREPDGGEQLGNGSIGGVTPAERAGKNALSQRFWDTPLCRLSTTQLVKTINFV